MAHGLTITETSTGSRVIKTSSLAYIGLMATAGAVGAPAIAALDAAFPLNTPVLVTDIESAIGDAGTTGTLKPALEAIADQTTPIVVVVRVAQGEDAEETEANVIGAFTDNQYTGIKALHTAEAKVGVRPRILAAPGLDTQAVTAELVIAAKRLRAFAYARAEGDTQAEALTYRDEFSARELMLIWPNWTGDFAGDAIARAVGLRARIDEEQGWHKTLSNVAVDGVTGIDKDVSFDLLDPSTAAGVLNDGDITTLIRVNGYRYWGNRTTSDIPAFAFESAVRTSHALQDIIAAVIQPVMDQPMTVRLIRYILETVNAAFRDLQSQGKIIGAECFFDADANNAVTLAAGAPRFRIEYTPCAPLENPNVQLNITDYYYTGFADQVS